MMTVKKYVGTIEGEWKKFYNKHDLSFSNKIYENSNSFFHFAWMKKHMKQVNSRI